MTELPAVSRLQRWLLPAELVDGSGGGAHARRRSPRDVAVDLTMIAAALAIGAAGLVDTWSQHGPLIALLDIVLGIAAILALWLRRAHPLEVAAFTIVISSFSAFAGGAALAAAFTVAIRCPARATATTAAGLIVAGVISSVLYMAGSGELWTEVTIVVLLTVVVVGWGLFVRVRRQLVLTLHERARRMEAEQQLRLEQARQGERARIAREMHDVLAHRVSLLAVHAGALEFRRDASPDEVAQAAGVIRESAHTALQELRDVIGLLREDGEADATESPQPTLAQVPALVDESRAAGMRVACTIDVAADQDAPELLGRTAYRVVQEGLTNARKHAPGAAVEIAIRGARGTGIVVEVRSRLAIGAAPAGAAALPGAGTGLAGLAERVALAGGELWHGPVDDREFLLRATLPWAP